MKKFKITLEFEDEVEAESESEALTLSTGNINEWIGSAAIVEEIKDNEQNSII